MAGHHRLAGPHRTLLRHRRGCHQKLRPDEVAGMPLGLNQGRSRFGSRSGEGLSGPSPPPPALRSPPNVAPDAASDPGPARWHEPSSDLVGHAVGPEPSQEHPFIRSSTTHASGMASLRQPSKSHQTLSEHRWGPSLASRARRGGGHAGRPEPSGGGKVDCSLGDCCISSSLHPSIDGGSPSLSGATNWVVCGEATDQPLGRPFLSFFTLLSLSLRQ